MVDKIPVLSVRNLYKKFSGDIKYNLFYGFKDIIADLFKIEKDNSQLRPKEFWSINDISLDLFAGDILGVVGVNGSGKTTLMRIIAGIYHPESGFIYKIPEKKITAVFVLGAGLRPLFTGRENIYIEGAMYGMDKKEIDRKMSFIEEFSELQMHMDKPLGNYSSGMRARLAYSVALATEPDIFIIDEALTVGDSFFQTKCFEHLKQYAQKPGKAILFVSNHIRKVLKVANRVIVMNNAQIIYESTDIKEALNYYIMNCLKHLDEEQRQINLEKINNYNL